MDCGEQRPNMTNADKTAFPITDAHCGEGMTRREYFTAMALSGLCADSHTAKSDIARNAVELADATLAELEKTKS